MLNIPNQSMQGGLSDRPGSELLRPLNTNIMSKRSRSIFTGAQASVTPSPVPSWFSPTYSSKQSSHNNKITSGPSL